MKSHHYKTWIELSGDAIKNNVREMRHVAGPEVKLMAIVKSNAYGHGIFTFSSYAEPYIDWFGVDSLREGVNLRQQGIRKPILVLGYTLPHYYEEAAAHDIALTFYNTEEIPTLRRTRNLRIHLKIDTGMHRQGIYPENLPKFLSLLGKGDHVQGIYTHLGSAKRMIPQFEKFTQLQIARFRDARAMLEEHVGRRILAHAAATAGTLNYPESHFDMIRSGIGLYGGSQGEMRIPVSLKPVLAWKTMVAQVKPVSEAGYVGYDMRGNVRVGSTLLVLPIGYWHGYDRRLSGVSRAKIEVLIRGRRARVCGTISMDMLVVEAPPGVRVRLGEEVVLLGAQGKEYITAAELAKNAGTISYDILTGLNPLIYREVV